MELIKKVLSPSRLPIVVGLLLLVALPTTLFLVKKNQDTQQHASSITSTNKLTEWNTPTVKLRGTSLVIEIDGKRFYGNDSTLSLHSDPGDPTYTTLEASWKENDVEMRLYMYFTSDGTTWKTKEIRTYDGTSNGKWIYYTGDPMYGTLGSPYESKKFDKNSYKSDSGKIGYIHFDSLSVEPFINLQPTLTIVPSSACTSVTISSLRYGDACPVTTGTVQLNKGVTFTCSDGYSSSYGYQSSCKDQSALKEYAVQTCASRSVCVSPSVLPTILPSKPPLNTPTPQITRCDINGDGSANIADFTMYYYCIQGAKVCTPSMKTRADLVRNGKVDSSDLFQYSRACLNGTSPTPLPPQATYAPKPSVYPSLMPSKVTTPPPTPKL